MTNPQLTNLFTPKWTWRSVVSAGTISLGIYLLLPYMETLTSPPDKTETLRSVSTVELPPPPPPPLPRIKQTVAEDKPNIPKPEMEIVRRQLPPIKAAMNLNMVVGDVGGDFNLNFGISADALGDQLKDFVFDISDLDEPPRPLAQLKPIYPTRARMRKIEGYVVVEFIVLADGTVRDINIISAHPGDIFNSAAKRAIGRWRFSPGSKDGKAVATRVRQKVEFKLE